MLRLKSLGCVVWASWLAPRVHYKLAKTRLSGRAHNVFRRGWEARR